MLVASALNHQDRRAAIRATWGGGAALVFLLGAAPAPNPALERELAEEVEQHGDILRSDFLDTYRNLTLKTVAGMKWGARHCPQAEFVLKTDDDMYVNLPLLETHLLSQYAGQTKLITGCVKNGPQGAPQPVAAAGPGGPGLPFPTVHPLFTAGAGYVVSGDLVEQLYTASLDTPLVRVEDAYLTGYCARRVSGVRKVHNSRFSCGELVQRDCLMVESFTGHKVPPDRMFAIHSKLAVGECEAR